MMTSLAGGAAQGLETLGAMPGATVTFPMLGDWFAFSGSGTYQIFGLSLHWYGMIIALGFLLAALYCVPRAPRFGFTQDELIDGLIFGIPAGIIGARLYYVVFHFESFAGDFWSVFKIWEGGLAIYGGIIGAALTAVFYCRHKKIAVPDAVDGRRVQHYPIAPLLDLCGFGLLIGQTVGRFANFVNREAFGGLTDVFCRMGLTLPGQATIYVHPTFLYESLWNLVCFLLMHFLFKSGKRRFDGQFFLIYTAWYGLGRMFIEGLRTDSLYLFGTGIRVSQLLAALSFAAAAVLLVVLLRRPTQPALWADRRRELEASTKADTEGA